MQRQPVSTVRPAGT